MVPKLREIKARVGDRAVTAQLNSVDSYYFGLNILCAAAKRNLSHPFKEPYNLPVATYARVLPSGVPCTCPAPIDFLPTYKYAAGTDDYDTRNDKKVRGRQHHVEL